MKRKQLFSTVLVSLGALSLNLITSINPAEASATAALAEFLYQEGVFDFAFHSGPNQCRSLSRYNSAVNHINNAKTEAGAVASREFINESSMQRNCVNSIYRGKLDTLEHRLGQAIDEYQNPEVIVKRGEASNLVFFKTRREHFINAHDSAGNVSAQPTGNTVDVDVSDEIFRLIDINGGSLNNGDQICLKTRREHFINAHDSAGNVSAQPTGNCTDINVSDEAFTIYKVNGSGTINSGDKVYLKTRRDHFVNAYDSIGNVSAQPTGNTTDVNLSDEIFTIHYTDPNTDPNTITPITLPTSSTKGASTWTIDARGGVSGSITYTVGSGSGSKKYSSGVVVEFLDGSTYYADTTKTVGRPSFGTRKGTHTVNAPSIPLNQVNQIRRVFVNYQVDRGIDTIREWKDLVVNTLVEADADYQRLKELGLVKDAATAAGS